MTDNLCCDFIDKLFDVNAILIICKALRRYFSVEENLFFTLKLGLKHKERPYAFVLSPLWVCTEFAMGLLFSNSSPL